MGLRGSVDGRYGWIPVRPLSCMELSPSGRSWPSPEQRCGACNGNKQTLALQDHRDSR
jgi:hypothetical protein